MAAAGEQTRAKYILIGGFLGAGKTTAVARLARYLIERGSRVGLISNDQSTGLVDAELLRAQGFAVQEVAGGCFCCRFDSLLEASNKLAAENRPDVYIAEPVGSCTDLVATVSYPLRRIYGDRFTTAPLSVLVDPARAARVLGLEQGRSFSPQVVYVYRKQLEEADFIIVNKCDVLADSLRARLVDRLQREYPRAEVFCCSARQGTGLDAWFQRLTATETADGPTIELDYDRYAEGEALLGWLNCTVYLAGKTPFEGDALLLDLMSRFREKLTAEECEIAHLKMTLDANDPAGSISAVSLVGSDVAPDLRESLLERLDAGRLIINLRAEAAPELLRGVTENVLADYGRSARGVTVKLEHLECFRPAKPSPTHRMSAPV
jgi:G3E family GTPase